MRKFTFAFVLPALLLGVGCSEPEEEEEEEQEEQEEPGDLLPPELEALADGEWDLEVPDADSCSFELDLEQDDDELEGESEVDCRVWFNLDDGSYYYDFQVDDAEVEGEIDDGEVELAISFYDSFFETEIEWVIEGEIDGDEFEGELFLFDDFFGDIEGDIDR